MYRTNAGKYIIPHATVGRRYCKHYFAIYSVRMGFFQYSLHWPQAIHFGHVHLTSHAGPGSRHVDSQNAILPAVVGAVVIRIWSVVKDRVDDWLMNAWFCLQYKHTHRILRMLHTNPTRICFAMSRSSFCTTIDISLRPRCASTRRRKITFAMKIGYVVGLPSQLNSHPGVSWVTSYIAIIQANIIQYIKNSETISLLYVMYLSHCFS